MTINSGVSPEGSGIQLTADSENTCYNVRFQRTCLYNKSHIYCKNRTIDNGRVYDFIYEYVLYYDIIKVCIYRYSNVINKSRYIIYN